MSSLSCRVIRRNFVTVMNNTLELFSLMIPLKEVRHGQTPCPVGQ